MEVAILLLKTVVLRPYVFVFLGAVLFFAHRLLGWRRAGQFFLVTWITAFVCEFSSTRTGIPFGWYHYTLSSLGKELYLSNVPFMDSLSFTFLLYASYCMALVFLLPASKPQPTRLGLNLIRPRFDADARRSPSVLVLATFLFVFIDMVIDPIALRGNRWFLGSLYYYPEPGIHFGVPLANYVGWAVVGLISLTVYFLLDRHGPPLASSDKTGESATRTLLLGCGVYYAVLVFTLGMTFWTGESLMGVTGMLMYVPVTALLVLRLTGRLPTPTPRFGALAIGRWPLGSGSPPTRLDTEN